MHSLNHRELGRIIASERVRQASRAHAGALRHRPPPPVRARAAHAAARLALRLDRESARRAVA